MTTSIKEEQKRNQPSGRKRKERGKTKKRIRSNGPPTVSYGDGQDQAGTTRATSRGSRNSKQEGIIVVCAKNAGKDLSRSPRVRPTLRVDLQKHAEGGGWRDLAYNVGVGLG